MLRKLSSVVVVFTVVQALWADAAQAQVLRASPGIDAIPRVYLISSGERSAALVATPDGVTLDIDNEVLVRIGSDSDGNANIAVIQKDTSPIDAEVWSDSPLHVGDRLVDFEEIGTDEDTGESFYWVYVQEPNHYLFVDLAHSTIMVIEFGGVLDLVTRQKPEPTEPNHREIQAHPGAGAHFGWRNNANMSGPGRVKSSCALLDACFQEGHSAVPPGLGECSQQCDNAAANPGLCALADCEALCSDCLG